MMLLSCALCFSLLLLLTFQRVPTTTAAAATPAYTATDFILLNCGSSSDGNDSSSRTWNGDDRSRYATSNAASVSSAYTASHMEPSVVPVPYETARVFNSTFTYTFPVSAGPKFLRLYFYPDFYSGFDTSQSFFSVTVTNTFSLLGNFSAFLYSKNSSQPSFMKEFIINIEENQKLDLTFSPNPNSFAFVNGVEIVSIPDKLYYRGDYVPIKSADQPFYLTSVTALETLYRLNVGGSSIDIKDDSGPSRGMFRAWSQDNDYVVNDGGSWTPHREDLSINYTEETPPFSAPTIVYTTSRVMANYSRSLDWFFPVDSGFSYLLRLHFCEFQLEVRNVNERVFTISINNQTVDADFDVIYYTKGTRIPIFRDYITWVPNEGSRGKQDLWLSLFPYVEAQPKYRNALLNGLEIFKLNDTQGSLAAANPELIMDSSPPAVAVKPQRKKKGSPSSVIYAAVGSVMGVLAVVSVVSFLIFRRQRKVKDLAAMSDGKTSWVPISITSRSNTRNSGSGVALPSDLCRYFSLDEIKTATRNFDDNFVIGKGGFGNVYKGLIDGAATVAIKRLNSSSNQGAREFQTEIEMLSKLRHLHLVSLIGYCNENGEMILVYDYMAHGTLRDHLYNSVNPPLTWKQRLQICLGAAKGLHYLHTGAKNSIIHRDVKSTNILLDEKFVAKVSDFGLSKVGPTGGIQTHVSTVVKGSLGYVDPEYYRRQQLSDKSDVYSFGVVLFEVLCARPPIVPSVPREQVNLAEWGKLCLRKGTLEQIIDSNLNGHIAQESLRKFAETAVACLKNKGIDRPAMSDVVWSLDFAMQLQETAESGSCNAAEGDDSDGFVAVSPSQPLIGMVAPGTTDEEMFSRSSEVSGSKTSGISTSSSEKFKHGDVFSEIMNPLAR